MRSRTTLLAALIVALPLVGLSPPGGAAGPYCGALPGLTANVWRGAGVVAGADDQWEKDANWSLGTAPLRTAAPYVCVPSGGTPQLREGEEAQLVALDVAAGATLTASRGSKLFLYGEQTSQPSTVRGRLDVVGATFGGPARTEVLGRMVVASAGPLAAATLTTRECAYSAGPYRPGEQACAPGVPVSGAKGRVIVTDGATLEVSGGGVNLGDQFQLLVRGLLRVHSGGTIAADHGSRLELRPHTGATPGTGTLRFEDDGSLLEGKNDFGIASLATVVNQGLITKSGGAGTSLVTAAYSQPAPGAVRVDSGTLLLPSGSATAAQVGAGDAYGSGRCLAAQTPGCAPQTFAQDRQNAVLRVPSVDASGAAVLVTELTTATSPADIGLPVEAHATGLSATASSPAVLTLRYDERLLGGRGWAAVRIWRRPDGATTYAEVRPCLATGAPPSGQVSCVDRRGLAESSRDVVDAEGPGAAPDVVMVVRTLATSRWIAR